MALGTRPIVSSFGKKNRKLYYFIGTSLKTSILKSISSNVFLFKLSNSVNLDNIS